MCIVVKGLILNVTICGRNFELREKTPGENQLEKTHINLSESTPLSRAFFCIQINSPRSNLPKEGETSPGLFLTILCLCSKPNLTLTATYIRCLVINFPPSWILGFSHWNMKVTTFYAAAHLLTSALLLSESKQVLE